MRTNSLKQSLSEIEIKEGDIFDFVSLEWAEPNWEFDYPSMLIYPIVRLYMSGVSNETIIDLTLEHLTCVSPKILSEELSWEENFYGWNMKKLRRIANNLLNKKQDGIKNNFRVHKEKIQFVRGDDGWLDSKVLETLEF